MNISTFSTLVRSFQQAKELSRGLQSLAPAASLISQHTCSTRSPPECCVSHRCLHCLCDPLVQARPLMVQQVRHLRKVYPDPFEQDPEYFILPEEKTHLDLNHVPQLGNNGLKLALKVEEVTKGDNLGRLFAVIHIGGQQRKITVEDLVIVPGFFPPQIGDKIRLEKVMLVGGKDFTLFGRPLLDRSLVRVEATVIEKTLSHVKIHYTQLKRFRRLKLHQSPQSVLVINSIDVDPAALSQS